MHRVTNFPVRWMGGRNVTIGAAATTARKWESALNSPLKSFNTVRQVQFQRMTSQTAAASSGWNKQKKKRWTFKLGGGIKHLFPFITRPSKYIYLFFIFFKYQIDEPVSDGICNMDVKVVAWVGSTALLHFGMTQYKGRRCSQLHDVRCDYTWW
jgi:hypothetical protein